MHVTSYKIEGTDCSILSIGNSYRNINKNILCIHIYVLLLCVSPVLSRQEFSRATCLRLGNEAETIAALYPIDTYWLSICDIHRVTLNSSKFILILEP